MTRLDSPSSALSELYSDHHGWLRGWLRKKVGCGELAADIAHDTFVRILGARDLLIGIAEPRAFLATTARRLLIDHSRRQRIEQVYLSELAAAHASTCEMASPEAVLAAVDALHELVRVFEALPEKAREAFQLHYVDGESQANVATRMGISIRMVQKYLTRALLCCHRIFDC
ncbi:sigma-70 family RNA polymerase sigma factor [Pararobbsia silviterrae]|uniref:Sigma-70 family RNA polymerase sigma factor n=1 Tax=Pararobbsia silviterrae TaxID=1792498 RepID=A0A494XA89_9BURK|nr:sigma-70 family RNA polymerase sigma factor [Pararobbsia silviterrae]RKP47675.1 sigma-70 family RNA polymerase sigma factor [Pararobbsia silviterrae]